MHIMVTNEIPRGPIGAYVVENVKRLREGKDWSYPRLSKELKVVGRSILPTGLHRLENGKRRVDADDLVALAAALDVSPITLLMPFTSRGEVKLTDKIEVEALAAWDWMRGTRPLDLPDEREEAVIRAVAFQGRALPMGARALDTQLTGFFAEIERRPDGPSLDWDTPEEAVDGEHPEAP